MITKFEEYKKAKTERDYAAGWAQLLGKPYQGGGGGIGKLVYVKLSTADMQTPTLYYQDRDGDKNYHQCPRSLLPYLDAAIRESFGALLANALAAQESDLKIAAAAALAERQELEAAAA